ncbi:hypothetical protein SDC9_186207 [bioreactor metagenome]|uniref:Uncharacterized protein n=1 Tax=bioreactor metagenome TaxID=1076179 RepID=A0A645HJX1_9ZZZZ
MHLSQAAAQHTTGNLIKTVSAGEKVFDHRLLKIVAFVTGLVCQNPFNGRIICLLRQLEETIDGIGKR